MYLWVSQCNYCYKLFQNHSDSQATQSREGILFFKQLSKRKLSHARRCVLSSCFFFPPQCSLLVYLINGFIFLIFKILY